MSEQKSETTEKKEDNTDAKAKEEDTGSGDKYETTPIIERAREEREKLEVATKAQKEENDRTERIIAKQTLGGRAEGGSGESKEVEETPKEYNDRIEKELSEGKHND